MATITGTPRNNTLTGTSGSDLIDGGAGDDLISGKSGADTLIGGSGSDEVNGGAGDDIIYGGTQGLNATGSGNDELNGGDGNDTIYGGDGRDTLAGGSGNDTLYGEAGNDTLDGNSGNDILAGGTGADKLTGGSGSDIYAINSLNDSKATTGGGFDSAAGDTINGFASTSEGGTERDKIDLRGLASAVGHALSWSGTTPMSYGVWYAISGGVTYVYVDTTGNAVADTVIKINSTETLSASDFLGLATGDTTAPTITSISYGSNDGTLKAGESVTLSVTFSETVFVEGGLPSLSLSSGGTATFVSGSGSNTLVFTYQVGAGQNAPDLAVTGLNLNGATIRDAANNVATLDAAATNPTDTLVVDTTAPEAGQINLSNFNDSGSSGSDGLTNDKTFDLNISGNELNSTVTFQVSEDGGASWTDTNPAQSDLLDGSYLFRGMVSDAAGNVAYSASKAVVIDTQGPVAGTLSLADLLDTGALGDSKTNDANFDLALVGNESGSTAAYQISINGGDWIPTEIAQTGLADGTYQFRALVTDAAGNESVSNVQTVTIDTEGPLFTVTLDPVSGDNILSSLETRDPVAISGTLTGEFQDGAAVTVTVNGVDYHTTASNGSFSVAVAGSDLVSDPARNVHVSVEAVDDAGNVATANADLSYDLSIEGVGADGYIAGALVFADTDGDGQLDVGEAQTTTDAFGNFTLVGGSGRLVLQGGTDISTGLAFTGTLTALAGSTVVTPLTTILVTLTETTDDAAAAEALLKSALGLGDVSAPLADYDPVQAVLAGAPGAAGAMTAAVLLQNTIAQAAGLLTGANPTLAEEEARAAVLDGITQQIAATGGAALDLTNSTIISGVIEAAAANTSVEITQQVLDAATQVIQDANAATSEAGNATDPLALLTGLAQVQIAVETTVTDVLQSNDAGALGEFDTADLEAAISDAADAVGDVDGGAVIGTEAGETLNGTAGDDSLFGFGGNDTINGDAGNDLLVGGEGDDTLIGNGGADIYAWNPGDGSDTIVTTDGEQDVIRINGTFFDYDWNIDGDDLLLAVVTDDSYTWENSLRIQDFFAGGDGLAYMDVDLGAANDWYSPGSNTSKLYFNVGNGEDQGNNNELIFGTSGADVMTDVGTQGFNVFWAGDGNDIMTAADGTSAMFVGGRGDDVMNGSDERGVFRGGSGNDTMNGGAGLNDLVRYERQNASDPFTHGVFVNLTDTAQTQDFLGTSTTVQAGTVIDNWGDIDTLNGIEHVRGSNFADVIIGSGGDNQLEGLGGDDTLIAGGGNDYLFGGDGNDTLIGGASASTLNGDNGDDQIFGGSGSEYLSGGSGDDIIRAGGNDGLEFDFVSGGDGSDTFVFGAEIGVTHIEDFVLGVDRLQLEDGVTIDNVSEDDWGDPWGPTTTLSLSNGGTVVLVSVAGITNVDDLFRTTISGTPGADVLTGTVAPEIFVGGQGDDTLIGNGGADVYVWNAGDGNDTIVTTDGEQDVIQINGTFYDYDWRIEGGDLLVGVVADGTYTLDGNLRIQDFFAGGDGIAYMEATVDPNNQYPTGNRYYMSAFTGEDQGNQFEWVFGQDGTDDVLTGGGGAIDRLIGLGGNDTLSVSDGTFGILLGGDGDDTLLGADQNDSLRGGSGDDIINGGAGDFDNVQYRSNFSSSTPILHGAFVNLSTSAVTVDFLGASTTVQAGQAIDNWGDTDTILNVESVGGSNFDDVLIGSAGGNNLDGRGGNDVIRGGGAGDGELDFLYGGGGADSFVFGTETGETHIEDFEVGVDVLRLEDGVTIASTEEQEWDPPYGPTTVLTLSSGATVVLVSVAGITNIDDLFRTTISGTPGADVLTGTAAPETFVGGEGDDTLIGNGGDDIYVWNAGDGNDTIVTTDGEEDVIKINSTFYDYYWNVEGNDLVVGVVADDSYTLNGSLRIQDFFAGGDGIDYMDATVDPNNQYPTGTRFYMSAFTGEDQGNQFEWVFGQDGTDDVLTGGGGAIDRLIGLGGNDTLSVSDGTFGILLGGDGDDTLLGADQNDSLRGGSGNDIIDGGAGDFDQVDYRRSFTSTTDIIHGVFVNLSTSAVTADFLGVSTVVQAGTAIDNWGDTDSISNVERVMGSDFNDIIIGGSGRNQIDGRGGDDIIRSGGNASGEPEFVWGGSGADSFIFGTEGGETHIEDFEVGIDVLRLEDGVTIASIEEQEWDPPYGPTTVLTLSSGATVVLVSVAGITDPSVLLPNIVGGAGAQTLTGSDAADVITGLGGDDTLIGNGGADVYVWNAGDGNDTIVTTDGEQDVIQINGTFYDYDWRIEGGDLLVGVVADGTYTLDGNLRIQDFFAGGDGIAYMEATVDPNNQYPTGNRYYMSAFTGEDQGNQFEWVFGQDGTDDVLTGGGGAIDRLIGLGGNDTLSVSDGTFGILLGGDGDDTLLGADQNDSLRGGSGDDIINGGAGDFDNVQYRSNFSSSTPILHGAFVNLSTSAVTVDFLGASTTVQAGQAIDNWGDTDTILNVESVGGSNFDDVLIGSAGNNQLDGRGGNDDLRGGEGGDYLTGQSGNDVLDGGAGNDTLEGGNDDDILDGGSDDDQLGGGSGNDELYGGDGDDYLFGDVGDDYLAGSSGSDGIDAGDGNDILEGGSGDDNLNGEGGNDLLSGGSGLDFLHGGDGDDVIRAGGTDPGSTDYVWGEAGADSFVFGTEMGETHIEDFEVGVDVLSLMDGVTIASMQEQDWGPQFGPTTILTLSTGATVALVSVGGVTDPSVLLPNIVGGAGAQTLIGSDAADVITGLDGDDTLIGGGGSDYMWGGTGTDTFVFNNLYEGVDTIQDFAAGDGGDVLDFSSFGYADAEEALTRGTQQDADVLFTLDSGTAVVLVNTDYASLSAFNFLV